MTDNVTKFPEPPKRPDLLVGPFEEYRVVVDGYQIPLLTGYLEGDKIWLSCDNRFSCGPFDEEQAYQAALLAAECMAIMTGHASLHCQDKKPFAPRLIGVPEIPK
jgi:hypothetical protein